MSKKAKWKKQARKSLANNSLSTMTKDSSNLSVVVNESQADGEYKNQLNVLVHIAPDVGVTPLRYRARQIKCESMPFLDEVLLPSISQVTKQESSKLELPCIVKRSIERFLSSFGFDVEVHVEPVMALPELERGDKTNSAVSVSRRDVVAPANKKNPEIALSGAQATRQPVAQLRDRPKGHDYRRLEFPEDQLVNLFVDLGSTNSKYIVTRADVSGKSVAFRVITLAQETLKLCGEWGIDYDKESAYKLCQDEFSSWLKYAVLGFMLHVQRDVHSNVFNIKWSFPKVEGVKSVDFKTLSTDVTNDLRDHGLKGSFELIPEGESLMWMFKDRVIELAQASEAEEEINAERSRTESANRKHNERESDKERQSKIAREAERRAWNKEHYIKRWFCKPELSTPLYSARYKEVNLGREMAMKAFRKTGAKGDGKFDILILDAGGSTLDFCYVPYDAKVKTSSFRAGGRRVTEVLAEKLGITIEEAEKKKKNLSDLEKHPLLLEATSVVYDKPLKEIANAVGCRRPLCVITTGLGMMNKQLRNLIKSELQLANEQLLIYSPDIVALFPKPRLSKFPRFKDFVAIVNKIVENGSSNGSPWPGSDVCGGMYFKSLNT